MTHNLLVQSKMYNCQHMLHLNTKIVCVAGHIHMLVVCGVSSMSLLVITAEEVSITSP